MTEYFETFDAAGAPLGLVPRDEVHRRGLWHRSAHVFLFDASGRLYLQRRAADKDLYPDLWDYSIGEHLQPGESFLAGALRGLHEELGVEPIALTPIGDVRAGTYRCVRANAIDRELQQAFRATYEGALQLDAAEVAEVRTVTLAELAHWLAREPAAFTPWLQRDVVELGILKDQRSNT